MSGTTIGLSQIIQQDKRKHKSSSPDETSRDFRHPLVPYLVEHVSHPESLEIHRQLLPSRLADILVVGVQKYLGVGYAKLISNAQLLCQREREAVLQ